MCSVTNLYHRSLRNHADTSLRSTLTQVQCIWFLVMSKHCIHYNMNIYEQRQCCFDSSFTLPGIGLHMVLLIFKATVVQESLNVIVLLTVCIAYKLMM